MDPNETLRQLLAIARKVLSRPGTDDEADDLAARILDLDEWLIKGGFLPARWLEKRDADTRTMRLCPGCRSLDGEHDFGSTCTLSEKK